MPLIMFPDVPLYPGVPQLLRPVSQAIAANPILAIGIGTAETLLITALNQAPQWGIYDATDGSQLGINPNSGGILSAIGSTLLAQITGDNATVLSTFGLDYIREARISDYPIEQGGFASFNKVVVPANPKVTLILDGSENERTTFLEAIDNACQSTDLYNVVTPEMIYANYTLERYSYGRYATKGLTLLMVEVTLKEIRTVTATFSTTLIPNPQNAAATSGENNGITQTTAPAASTLSTLSNQVSTSLSSFFGGG